MWTRLIMATSLSTMHIGTWDSRTTIIRLNLEVVEPSKLKVVEATKYMVTTTTIKGKATKNTRLKTAPRISVATVSTVPSKKTKLQSVMTKLPSTNVKKATTGTTQRQSIAMHIIDENVTGVSLIIRRICSIHDWSFIRFQLLWKFSTTLLWMTVFCQLTFVNESQWCVGVSDWWSHDVKTLSQVGWSRGAMVKNGQVTWKWYLKWMILGNNVRRRLFGWRLRVWRATEGFW